MSNVFRVGIDPINSMFRDVKAPSQAIKLDPTNPPTPQLYKGGYVLSFSSASDNIVYFNMQLNHDWKAMTDLEAHVHIVLPVAGAGLGAENIKFDLTYSWAHIGYIFPGETTITATRDVQNDASDTHIYFDLGSILESNAAGTQTNGVSSMLICSLKRDTGVANDYASAVYLLEADFHVQVDSIGSRLEVVK